MKGGVGSASIELPDGLIVARALVVVNAEGDVVGPSGDVIAGVRTEDGQALADARKLLRAGTRQYDPAEAVCESLVWLGDGGSVVIPHSCPSAPLREWEFGTGELPARFPRVLVCPVFRPSSSQKGFLHWMPAAHTHALRPTLERRRTRGGHGTIGCPACTTWPGDTGLHFQYGS